MKIKFGRHFQHNKFWYKYWFKLLNPRFIHEKEVGWIPVYKILFWYISIDYGKTNFKIIFSGDRKSKTIKVGRKLRNHLPFVEVSLWDGYKSRIYFE